DRVGLLPGLGAEHVEADHDLAVARVAGLAPGLAVEATDLGHVRARQRDGHQAMAETTGVFERLRARRGRDPERRPRRLGRPRQRGDVLEAAELALAGDVLLLEE